MVHLREESGGRRHGPRFFSAAVNPLLVRRAIRPHLWSSTAAIALCPRRVAYQIELRIMNRGDAHATQETNAALAPVTEEGAPHVRLGGPAQPRENQGWGNATHSGR